MSSGSFRVPQPVNEEVLEHHPGSPERDELKAELARQKASAVEIPIVLGEHATSSRTFPVTAPHEKALVLGRVHEAAEEHVHEAIRRGLEIRADWAGMPWEERVSVFLKAADLITGKYRARMNAATMLGQSKNVHQAEIDAVAESADFLRFNAWFAERLYADQPISSRGHWNRSVARGLEGFVYAVSPFNFTSIALNIPCAPALMGCSVVWKPARTSLLSSWVIMQVLEEAGLPPGVITMLSGPSRQMTDIVLAHPDFAGLHFTGSTEVFTSLWQTISARLKTYKAYPRMVGETGGKDFVFAHASADAESLVTALVRGAFEYQGQKCSAASRAYIPGSLWPAVREMLVAQVRSIRMGSPEDFRNFVNAVIDKSAFDRIVGYIEEARNSNDANILAGGEYDDSAGYFIRPTVIEARTPRYRSLVEEIFGPVLSVFVYEDDDLDDILDECDRSTPYGLTGAVFARDRRVIKMLSDRLENAAGNFYINDKPTGAVVGQQPFGGARCSGTNDKAGSMYNLLRWVSHRTIKETFSPPRDYRYPFMDAE